MIDVFVTYYVAGVAFGVVTTGTVRIIMYAARKLLSISQ